MTEVELRSALADNIALQQRLDDIDERLAALDIELACGSWAATWAVSHA